MLGSNIYSVAGPTDIYKNVKDTYVRFYFSYLARMVAYLFCGLELKGYSFVLCKLHLVLDSLLVDRNHVLPIQYVSIPPDLLQVDMR